MKRTKIPRNTFIGVSVLALTLLAGGISNGVLGFGNTPLGGAIITFDAPGAGTGPGQGTLAGNINASGAITGWYIDTNDVSHGFVRAMDGTFTTFDSPGAGTGPGQGTSPYCNNARDAITGFYVDTNNTWHGFLRAASQPTPRPRPTPPPRP